MVPPCRQWSVIAMTSSVTLVIASAASKVSAPDFKDQLENDEQQPQQREEHQNSPRRHHPRNGGGGLGPMWCSHQ